jgi:hypothetical protein
MHELKSPVHGVQRSELSYIHPISQCGKITMQKELNAIMNSCNMNISIQLVCGFKRLKYGKQINMTVHGSVHGVHAGCDKRESSINTSNFMKLLPLPISPALNKERCWRVHFPINACRKDRTHTCTTLHDAFGDKIDIKSITVAKGAGN